MRAKRLRKVIKKKTPTRKNTHIARLFLGHVLSGRSHELVETREEGSIFRVKLRYKGMFFIYEEVYEEARVKAVADLRIRD
ncbi:hypothetical protein L9W92_16950 [Pelotomaculum terephthalicicum JT]|uniref:hypothetical protein n=1 Tax=Pelotomaculum terephthalicicum TaxID=206393 RepID=UPI001F04DCC2|nr:hypothetical protein [Pelotomaculum terephthalicicum]MCG9969692.1 hypothetical protein [Pelotomaculum terephthalicicum JT]